MSYAFLTPYIDWTNTNLSSIAPELMMTLPTAPRMSLLALLSQ